eukprot:3010170-Pleurochrysis_carterae.AAC.4
MAKARHAVAPGDVCCNPRKDLVPPLPKILPCGSDIPGISVGEIGHLIGRDEALGCGDHHWEQRRSRFVVVSLHAHLTRRRSFVRTSFRESCAL